MATEKKEKRVGLFSNLKGTLFDKVRYENTIRIIIYIILCVVALLMTILNFMQFILPEIRNSGKWPIDILTITTAAFTVAMLPNIFLSLYFKWPRKICSFLFAIELVAMFSVFLWSGKPEGFSALWIPLLPTAAMIFYGKTKGSILCAIVFVILILGLWTPVGGMINIYNGYSDTFKTRFPILYISFYFIALFLELIQSYQFRALEAVNKKNAEYSSHDQLTGLFNRKGFYDKLNEELKEKNYSKIGFIVFDIDFFKKLNDKYGHLAGDQVLIAFAGIIKRYLGQGIACRWGGEEFLVCYFDDDVKKLDLERFRAAIEENEFNYQGEILRMTVSGGVFETNDKDISNTQKWLANADEALYKAKETGRNKIVYF